MNPHITSAGLRRVVDALYPPTDPRHRPLPAGHRTAVVAGLVRSWLRGLADDIDSTTDTERTA